MILQMQYKIPQNINIADKIVGPFSLKQLIIVAAGGGTSYVIFALASQFYELNILEYIIIAIPLLLSLAIALVKINNVTFTKFILLFLEFNIKPKKRLWDHRGIAEISGPILQTKKEEPEKSGKTKKTVKKKVNLSDLSRLLDSKGFQNENIVHHDMDKAKDDDLITQAFFGHKRGESKTQNMYWRTKESQKKRLDLLAKMPVISEKS